MLAQPACGFLNHPSENAQNRSYAVDLSYLCGVLPREIFTNLR